MPDKRRIGKEIVIRGRAFPLDTFKIHELDEDEIPRIFEGILSIGVFARTHGHTYEEMENIVNSSPLLHLEGLIRHQLNRLLVKTAAHLSIDDLSSVSDFIHEEHSFREVNNIQVTFLFNFLRDVVSLSSYPENINDAILEKLSNDLRSMFIQAAPQIDGAKGNDDTAWHHFICAIWGKLGASESASAEQVWNKAIHILEEAERDGEEVSFELTRNSYRASICPKIVDLYFVSLEIEEGQSSPGNTKKGIRIQCDSKDIPGSRLKRRGQFGNEWKKLRTSFLGRR